MYPVGSCYFSTVNTSPATIVGGTWVAMTGGMLGLAGSKGVASAGDDGGSVKISIEQMPEHTHNLYNGYGDNVAGIQVLYWINRPALGSTAWLSSTFTQSTGGGADYIPAHTSVYGWRRTA